MLTRIQHAAIVSENFVRVQAGRDPQHVVREPTANRFNNIVVISDVIPLVSDWKEYTKSREAV